MVPQPVPLHLHDALCPFKPWAKNKSFLTRAAFCLVTVTGRVNYNVPYNPHILSFH